MEYEQIEKLADEVGAEWPMSRELELEGAMVLWEEMLDVRAKEKSPYESPMGQFWDNLGTVSVRHEIMPLIGPLHVAWHVHYQNNGDMVSYDWEFTPWFLKECVTWHARHGAKVRPDFLDRARNFKGD